MQRSSTLVRRLLDARQTPRGLQRVFVAVPHAVPSRSVHLRVEVEHVPGKGLDEDRLDGKVARPAAEAATDETPQLAAISVFEMFSIGIGPSSSHTVGPMRAAHRFASLLLASPGLVDSVARVKCALYGSLALTGIGHGTPGAVMLGLEGNLPDTVDVEGYKDRLRVIRETRRLRIGGRHDVEFDDDCLPLLKSEVLPQHANGMEFSAFDASGELLLKRRYYSIGGGFFVSERGAKADDALAGAGALAGTTTHSPRSVAPPFPFRDAADVVAMCRANDISVQQLALENELAWRSADDVHTQLMDIWRTMEACIDRGLHTDGELGGGLGIRRRAPGLWRALQQRDAATSSRRHAAASHGLPYDAVSAYAIAVNEENAAGGRVVTAPTNGAAGIIPAVLRYYVEYVHPHMRTQTVDVTPDSSTRGPRMLVSESPAEALERCVAEFLLTAGLVGMLFKSGASISAAEVGCQGEVGVACSMAAAALAAVQGGTVEQVESAAEIGMEHNLGLTCDPIGGLVQVPCIERNVMGAVKAITAARLALSNNFNPADGGHTPVVSLDNVIATMLATGRDMQSQYKETSEAGLAIRIPVNVTAC